MKQIRPSKPDSDRLEQVDRELRARYLEKWFLTGAQPNEARLKLVEKMTAAEFILDVLAEFDRYHDKFKDVVKGDSVLRRFPV